MEPNPAQAATSDSPEPTDLPDADLGGEPPCWMHLLDDNGRMPESP